MTTTAITLREYQREAIDKVLAAEERGVRAQLGVAATGLGKTVVFASLIAQRGVPALILAHRDELITQAAHKVLEIAPELGATENTLAALVGGGNRIDHLAHNPFGVGIVKASANDTNANVVIASVQTLGRMSRLDKMPTDHFGIVVVDEAHHAKADSYKRIIEHLGAGKEGGPLLLGVTATPDRGDGKGLDDIFDEIIFNYDMLWGIRAGYLSDLRGRRVYLDADFSKIKVSKGDYEAGAAGAALVDANAPSEIADAWLKYADGRQTLVFTPTVETASLVAEELQARGVAAAMISGNTPSDERRATLRAYGRGEIKVIANCAVLTEGFDEPATACIVMARPTKSRALYTQCIGRGTRRHPDKTDCLVIDVVGASSEHSLITVPSLFGLKNVKAFEAGDGTVTGVAMEEAEEAIRKGQMKAAEVDLFRRVLESPIAWASFAGVLGRSYACSLGRNDGMVVIEPMQPERDDAPVEWTTYVRWEADRPGQPSPAPKDDPRLKFFRDGTPYRPLISNVDLEIAQGVGEDYIRKSGSSVIADRNAAWRKRPPTPKQLDAAAKWKMDVDPSWNAGQLSDALNTHIAAAKARSKNRAPRAKTRSRW